MQKSRTTPGELVIKSLKEMKLLYVTLNEEDLDNFRDLVALRDS